MPIAVTDDHESLRQTAERWLATHCPPSVPRAVAQAETTETRETTETTELPEVWGKMAAQGWLGLHLPEAYGGEGFTLNELAVVLEELGHALFPGPILPTVLVSTLLARHLSSAGDGTDDTRGTLGVRSPAQLLAGLADGSITGAVALGHEPLAAEPTSGSSAPAVRVSGTVRPVLGSLTARLVLVPLAATGSGADGVRWWLIDREDAGPALRVEALVALDGTRTIGSLQVDGLVLAPDGLSFATTEVRHLALVLAAAESAGIARWALETASEYAKVRVQFGRPIGQFQAVKHALADMLVKVEQAAAVAWDAAAAWSEHEPSPAPERALSARVAGVVALEAAAHCTKQCIQTLGGIGFTWEHDAHLYLKRALANRQLLADGDTGALELEVAALAIGGARRGLVAELPPEAEALRREIREVVAVVASADEGQPQRDAFAEAGLIMPHWPPPWGRGASPLEQLVIDEELTAAGLRRPHLAVGAWSLPTLIAHGTEEQQERWVRPTLHGKLQWCQLFSEPGAGSDLAALSTRADRVEGGYVLNGQKVWTSLAREADFGICLARTDPAAPKHAGITFFIIDMRSPGIDIRPLRELTGAAMFNEVFFTDVFVPDDAVVGAPGSGWHIGRTTLANERVSMSSGAAFGTGVESLIRTVARRGETCPPSLAGRLGHLLAEAQSLALLGHRATLHTLSGGDAGAAASVRKLLGVEHEQRVQEMGLALYGADAAVLDGRAKRWEDGFLATRCLTIAGGTSEVQRNVIAERILGQPRDPEPGE